MAAPVLGEKLFQDNKQFPGHGSCLVKMYDTKGGKNTIVQIKIQGNDLSLDLNESNEEDITTQFKVKRATKEFCKIVLDRLKIAMVSGKLQIDFDWKDIRRIQIEAAEKAKKLEEIKKKNEEDRIAKEKKKEEERKEAEKKKLEEEKKKKEEERRKKEEEELKKKKEQERLQAEANAKRKAFEDKIMGAQLGGGVLTDVKKILHKDEAGEAADGYLSAEDAIIKFTKTYSEEQQDFYYVNEDTNEVSWRNPNIKSVWEKLWDADNKQFYYMNSTTHVRQDIAPWAKRYERIYIPDRKEWVFVNIETGDVQDDEPYY